MTILKNYYIFFRKKFLISLKTHEHLKKTPKDSTVFPLGDGGYVHYGLKDGLTDFLMINHYAETNFTIDFNVDGLPLTKSSRSQAWPILSNIVGTKYVFLV